jgi:hypothetical protein
MTPAGSRRQAVVAALVLLATGACSREKAAPADAATAAVAVASATPGASASAGGAKAFGAFCVEDSECAGAVCFHKRLKTAASGPERRGGGDAVEHDGYCSMSCNTDADCPSPPSNGRCGARGMCKRPE